MSLSPYLLAFSMYQTLNGMVQQTDPSQQLGPILFQDEEMVRHGELTT